MIVVADTSPLNYLALIDETELLPKLFDSVLVPPAVISELTRAKTPQKVRQWLQSEPSWLIVQAPPVLTEPSLLKLGPGESEAIQLALVRSIESVLIDEAQGRAAAERFGLKVRGTLSILELAARAGECDFRNALRRLEQTSFRMSPQIRAAFLRRNP